MKNLSLLFCLLLSSSLIFVGCKKDDNSDPATNYPTTDEGVEINGVVWATRNVAAPGTFVFKPEDTGMYYQWNRKVGWSSTDPLQSSNNAKVWDNSIPEGTEWEQANDPCPKGWRVPTYDELQSLLNTRGAWKLQNNVVGYPFGEAPNQIFLPAGSWRYQVDGTLSNSLVLGYYWSNIRSADQWAWGLYFIHTEARMETAVRASGRTVRCVKN